MAQRQTGVVSVRMDRDLLRRLEAARQRAEREEGGHLPVGTFARRLIVRELDRAESSGIE
jgi:hypothetical protein